MDAAQPVTRIAGIGRTFASHLRARGITTIGELRVRLATPEIRRVLAWETGLSERKLETWHRLAQDDAPPAPTPALLAPEEFPVPVPVPVPLSAEPTRAAIRSSDGLSGDESTEIAAEPIDVAELASSSPPPAEPPVLEPIVDDALVAPAPPPPPDVALAAPLDPTPLLRSVGRMRTFSLAVLAAALVTLATAISLQLPRGGAATAPDPLLSAGASPEAHIEKANALFREGQADAAEIEYRLALALDPSSVPAHVQLGRAMLRQRKFAEAVAVLEKAIAAKPDVAAAHYYLSSALLGRKDAAGALAAAREAVKLDPAFPWSYYNVALAWDLIPSAPPLPAVEHRASVRALLLDLETATGDGLATTIRLLERLTERTMPSGGEAFPGAVAAVRDAWLRWGAAEGYASSDATSLPSAAPGDGGTAAAPQPADAVGESR